MNSRQTARGVDAVEVAERVTTGKDHGMRFRAGLIVGFGAGYYLGTMAGRERHEQINRMLRKVKRSDVYDTATDKAKAVVDLGVERAKDLVGTNAGNGTYVDLPRTDPPIRP
jgi:hypothetical protein